MPTSTTPVAVAIVAVHVPEARAVGADSVGPDATLAAAAADAPISEGPAAGRRVGLAGPVDRGDRGVLVGVLTGAAPGVMTTGEGPAVAVDRIVEAIVDRIGVRRSRRPCLKGSRSISFQIRPGSIR